MQSIIFTYLLMMLLQIWHIFEEIATGAYKVAGHGMNKYLMVASILVTINFTTLALLLLEIRAGFYLGLFTSGVLAAGNGIIHLIGAIKTKTIRDSIGAGVFSGIPLGIIGVIVFVQLITLL